MSDCFNGFFNKYPYTNYHELNLDFVFKKINEFSKRLDDIRSDILDESKKYTDSKFLELVEEYNTFRNLVLSDISNIDANYEEFTRYINNRLVLIDNKISDLQKDIGNMIVVANDYTDRAISYNNEYIIEETSKALSTVTVLNYFTGERVSIQDMFDYLAQFHLQNAITYEQIESRQKTVDFIVGLNKTVTEFVLNGGSLIPVS